MNEDKIDRRVHMVYWIVAGIVLATSWCVRLEFTVAGLAKDMADQHSKRDQTIKEMKESQLKDHDVITAQKVEIEWLKRGGLKSTARNAD